MEYQLINFYIFRYMLLMMKKVSCLSIFMLLSVCYVGCKTGRTKLRADSAARPVASAAPVKQVRPLQDEEQIFRSFFERFSAAVAAKKSNKIAAMMHFPFYTSHLETGTGMGAPSDALSQLEFANEGPLLFNGDIWKLLLSSKEDDLSEIDSATNEIYYQTLWRTVDKESRMYELYRQYPEKNTNAESFFAFVFGKVNGKYKAIAFYSKWPLK